MIKPRPLLLNCFCFFIGSKDFQLDCDEEDDLSIKNESLMHNQANGESKSLATIVLDVGYGKVLFNCKNTNESNSSGNCILFEVRQILNIPDYKLQARLEYNFIWVEYVNRILLCW